MPVPEIQRLSKDSSDAQVSAAISSCIATEVKAGREQDQAVAMCHEMVRGKTGKELAPKGGGQREPAPAGRGLPPSPLTKGGA